MFEDPLDILKMRLTTELKNLYVSKQKEQTASAERENIGTGEVEETSNHGLHPAYLNRRQDPNVCIP